MRLAHVLPLSLFPSLLACSSSSRVLTIDVMTGHETDAMSRSPAVDRVEVEGSTPDGAAIKAETSPGGELDFGDVDGDLAYTFEITGRDAEGNTVLRGRSIGGIILNGVTGDTLPLFAQRLEAWARPPGTLARAHTRAPAVSVGERYLLTTGGDAPSGAAEAEQYDLFAWAGAKGTAFPFAAETLLSTVTAVLAVGKDATWLDQNGFASVAVPEGLTSWAELAGGSVVAAPDGRVFVVGAARPDPPADAVLEIAADNSAVSVHRLTAPRAGAAAAWLADVGLVVLGGSASAEAVEVLPQQGTKFFTRPFAPDPTTGAAAIEVSGKIKLIGGEIAGAAATTRSFDPRCTSQCAAEDVDGADLPAALTRASAFRIASSAALASGKILVIGDEAGAGGLTRAFVLDLVNGPTTVEVPFREPRRGATAVSAPNGTLAVVGGVHPDGSPALTVEMFFPE